MYAPFGAGVLIGPMKTFEQGMPDIVGGGVVTVVTLDDVHWNAPPWREEAGSPNVLGAITLARVIDILQKVGMEAIADHEVQLLRYAYGKLKRIKKLVLYGPLENFERKVGVITFNVEGMADSLVAAVFSAEAGIGLRNGCFCAQPYVKRLLKVPPDEDERIQKMMLAGDKSDIPGMVRASIGCYNNEEDIDAFVETLERVVRGEIKGEYVLDRPSGSYFPKGFERAVESCMPPDGFAPAAAGAVYSEAS